MAAFKILLNRGVVNEDWPKLPLDVKRLAHSYIEEKLMAAPLTFSRRLASKHPEYANYRIAILGKKHRLLFKIIRGTITILAIVPAKTYKQ